MVEIQKAYASDRTQF